MIVIHKHNNSGYDEYNYDAAHRYQWLDDAEDLSMCRAQDVQQCTLKTPVTLY